MRKIHTIIIGLCVSCACGLLDVETPGSANGDVVPAGDGKGQLSVRFSDIKTEISKAGESFTIDTSSFILKVSASDGRTVFEGDYFKFPEELAVDPGTYTVSALSGSFSTPQFDSPQWGDSQIVKVEEGRTACVELLCRQMNCGIRMNVAPEFLNSYPQSVLFLKSTEGKLMYSYSEKRTAYFLPGLISLLLSTGTKDEVLLTRQLAGGEVLNLNVKVAAKTAGKAASVSISIDTSRVWVQDTYVLGGEGERFRGDAPDNPLTVTQARSSAGSKDVWVEGYVVGGDLSKSAVKFEGPFTSRSNMAIGPRWSTSDKSQCIAVELKDGPIRAALNLVDNPSVLGTHVVLKGDIESSYFSLTGLKNVTDYQIR